MNDSLNVEPSIVSQELGSALSVKPVDWKGPGETAGNQVYMYPPLCASLCIYVSGLLLVIRVENAILLVRAKQSSKLSNQARSTSEIETHDRSDSCGCYALHYHSIGRRGSMKGGHQNGHPEYKGDESRMRYKAAGVKT
jgi:hypothetical protein